MQAEKISVLRNNNPVTLETGKIESATGDGYRVIGESGLFEATTAFSCLVEPMVNDIVLVSVDTRAHCHILAIIDRPECNDTRLSLPGDVTLDARQGKLNLNSQQGINISSDQQINLASEECSVIAKKGLIGIESITAVGSRLVSKIGCVQIFSETVETVAVNLLQKLKNSFRVIEGVDQTRSRDLLTTVKNLYSIRSTQAAILAKKDIKVDAERIHMG